MHFAGIDLGNSRMKVATLDSQGNPKILGNHNGELFTLSCVFFEGSRAIIGSEAQNAGLLEPSHFVQNWKRSMGSDEVLCSANGKEYRSRDIAHLLLADACDGFSRHNGNILTEAAITVPANFNDKQKAEVIEAAKKAGIKDVHLFHEPTAAIFGNRLEKRGDGLSVLLDLGGSTFDVSLVKASGNSLDVVATNGEPRLGGQDFTQRIVDMVLEEYESQHGSRPPASEYPLEFYQLQQNAESAKISLSTRESTSLMFAASGKVVSCKLTQADFGKRCEDLVEKAIRKTMETLKEAGVKVGDLREIVPVGGASQMLCFLNAVEKAFGRKATTHADPFYAVALGAATLGRLEIEKTRGHVEVNGRKLPSLDYYLHDVTAHPVGIATITDHGGAVNSVILKKGAPIPSDVTEMFQLAVPGQTGAVIELLQGLQGTPALQCLKLGSFELKGLTPTYDAPHKIDIRFHIDKNGMLTATARDPLSGKVAELKLDYKQGKKSA